MGRDDDIQAILEVGRRTRTRTPRWLAIAAIVVGAICAAGFVVALLGESEPARQVAPRGDRGGSGFASGLAIGLAGGVAIGFALARHRRAHSSRSSP